MITTNSIRILLKNIANETGSTTSTYLDTISVYLKIHITLVDSCGSINYQSKIKVLKTNEHLQEIPLFRSGQLLATMLVDKENPTELEQALLEMLGTLISLHLR